MNPGLRALLTEVCKVMELILVIPATTASLERSFSRLKLIKIPLRSTMKQWCLNHFMMVNSLHPELADNLSTKEIADEFVSHCNDNKYVLVKNCLEIFEQYVIKYYALLLVCTYFEFSQLKGLGGL